MLATVQRKQLPASSIARQADARLFIPFHFSSRYAGREQKFRMEIEAAWTAAL